MRSENSFPNAFFADPVDFVIGVDGGNTKTVALAATLAGEVIGTGRAGPSDVYGVAAEDAFAAIEAAVRAAVVEAVQDDTPPRASAFCLAGADWPADFALYQEELGRRFAWSPAPHVCNDALAGVWTGTTPGVGVSIACGTWNAVGARSAEGAEWHSSFWCEPSGAVGIAGDAFTAMVRSELGIAPAEALTANLVAEYGATEPEDLLRFLTRRDGKASIYERARAAGVVLRTADQGDAVALGIVHRHATMLGDYGAAAARRVGLSGRSFHLTLTGGLFQHSTDILFDAIVDRVQMLEPRAVARRASLPPVAGAVLLALHDIGLAPDQATVAALRSSQVGGS